MDFRPQTQRLLLGASHPVQIIIPKYVAFQVDI